MISYAAGTTLVWTTTGYTSYANNGNCFIDNWSQTYTVGQNCNLNQIVTISGNDNLGNHSFTSQELVSTDFIISNGEFVFDENATVGSVTVNPGAKLSVNTGKTFASSSIILQSDATGTATFVDKGTSSITTANVQQYLPAARNWYISSPVSTTVVPSGSTYFGYQNSDNTDLSVSGATVYWKPYTAGDSLKRGKGYIAQPTSQATLELSGPLNTGNISIQLTRTPDVLKSGFNLVGNPYPSYLDWDMAIRTNVESTLWYRTKSSSAYVFDTYNAVSQVGTGLGLSTVSNLIPPAQAFWVRVSAGNATGTLTFNNSMRSHADEVTNRLKAPAVKTQQVLRLQVSNNVNRDEAIILFNSNASDAYDSYDSPKMLNGNPVIPELYTTVQNEKLVINGLNSIQSNREVPLGFITGQANTFSIRASEIKNFDTDTKIVLRDNLLNKEQELSDGSEYIFTSNAATTDNRFSVIFKTVSFTTDTENEMFSNQTVLISKNELNQITILCSGTIDNESTVSVYNSIGQKVLTQKLGSTKTVLRSKLSSGVYLVTVKNNQKMTQSKVQIN